MTAIYKALKNSNVSEYVKSRVLNNNLDYILENGVADLISKLSDPIDIDHLVVWQDGTLEVSIYGEFYSRNKVTTFKNSISGREDLKGINKNSKFYRTNKELLEKISKRVFELVNPFSKKRSKELFGICYDGFSAKSNVEKFFYFNDSAYIAVKDSKRIPEATLEYLEPIKLSVFYSLYEKEIADEAV